MAYSKAKISIPNVTGDIVITATATASAPTFPFTMLRTLTGGRTESGTALDWWDVNPPDANYAFGEFTATTAGQGNSGTDHNIYTNMTANSVSITNSGGVIGIAYPFLATSGKTYNINWTSAGTPRVYIGWWTDGTYSSVTNPSGSIVGVCSENFTAPTGTVVWGAVIFGGGTNADAQFTNVFINES